MIRKEKPRRRETKPGTGDHAPLFLRLDVLHALLPNHPGLNLVLNHLRDSLIGESPGALKHRNGGRRRRAFIPPFDDPRRQPQEQLPRRDGERLLLRRRWRRRRGCRGLVGVGVGGGVREGGLELVGEKKREKITEIRFSILFKKKFIY